MTRRFAFCLAVGLIVASAACAARQPTGAPPAAPPRRPPATIDQKISWILRLEQQRIIRDPSVVTPPTTVGAPAAAPAGGAAAATPQGPGKLIIQAATEPDLTDLARDTDPAIRRRAVLALGRVGLPAALPTLNAALLDDDEQMRAEAAFAAGLLGSREAMAPLQAALKDPSALVRGRAAEALGTIGEPASAGSIADAFSGCTGAFATVAPDSEAYPQAPEVDSCRLALFALVRLRQYDALARVALDPQGQPASQWWPVAFALQRINDKRAVPALTPLVNTPGVYTAAFALRGLAAAGDRSIAGTALALARRADADVRLRIAAGRALAQIGGADAVQPLLAIATDPASPPNLALEAVTTLGAIGDARIFNDLVDLFTDRWPAMRLAAMNAAARLNPESFVLVLSSLGEDREPAVRAGLASILAGLPNDAGRQALEALASDQDPRVMGPALTALARLGAPDLADRLFAALGAPDFAVRAAAAGAMGDRKPEGGVARLVEAYARAVDSDAAIDARVDILVALSKYGGPEAQATLTRALGDREWPVRVRAAELLRSLGDASAQPQRPAPLRYSADLFESEAILRPRYRPHAFLETRHGTIEIELNVVESPLTTHSFMELARAGFFNGLKIHRLIPHFVIQDGDPRGDGQGGPGYTIRDEFSSLPFVRGVVGLALSFPETGGSQFFITLSPQPHLDGRYTVFGRVVRGEEVLDRVQAFDVIERVRIWDGVKFSGH
jgi:cyclophilin family peptidyl-prolyl cis-trans isomerase/HEAT repeat protein